MYNTEIIIQLRIFYFKNKKLNYNKLNNKLINKFFL